MAAQNSGSLRWPEPGPSSVPDYQVSAIPWLTSSTVATTAVQLTFPMTTRWIEVSNTGYNELRIGFTQNGVEGAGGGPGAAYYTLGGPSGSTSRWEIRCSKLFVQSQAGGTSYTVAAGLTGIPSRYFEGITGSLGRAYSGIG